MGTHLRRLVNAFLCPSESAYRQARWQPSVDVYRTARGWLIKFELAGVRAEDIELSITGGRLQVRGLRRDVRIEATQRTYSMEISYNQFERTIELPSELEQLALTSEYRDGMLLVRLEAKVSDESC